ncbi:iron complex transport system ATP-binding protein [Natronincola peptidivorans]|uniref:Iron complex transport system ATP-binding protein n=1 Tax=Natronincola peptidivorans TaxID=426128 RepID=A0A1I0ECJ8_9FIRM|nr:ABC transporter ATP-binding protein [Natronincola peptidivorans]SET42474.1 iron complex transport system ATP-binding protein [Natronincola peptidivorans]
MIIDMKEVAFIREDEYILQGINWRVKPGEHWGILGLNGSGKTTLLNIINGYLLPSRGEVRILDKEFGKFDLRQLRKSIGWVSSSLQERLYVRETAKEIVLSGKFATIGLYDEVDEADIQKAVMLMEQLDCMEIMHKPYKILSQGEKQKVLIARALMASPKLLILDEPCTGLDMFARQQLLSVIEKIGLENSSTTLIYVTHRTEEISPVFSKTMLLKKGKIHSLGNTEEVLTSRNLSDFYKTPVTVSAKNQYRWVQIV